METELLKTTKNDILSIDPRRLVEEEGFNERNKGNFGDILGLALSMVAVGLLEPIIGHKIRGTENYLVTDGHRRNAGLMLAFENHAKGVKGFEDISKIQRVPLKVASADLKDRLYIMAITGTTKRLLTDIERASMFETLIKIGLEEGKKRPEIIQEIITKMGISKATVYNTLQITELPQVIKDRIMEGVIASGAVLAITRELKEPEQQIKAVERAIENATKTSEATGKKVKATAKDVKGLKAKTPMARIQEVVAKLEDKGVKNVRANALIALMKGLDEKQSLKDLFELFA